MFRINLFLVGLVFLAVVSAVDNLRPVDLCNKECEKVYDRNEEDACKHGCSRADAIELVLHNSKSSSTCNDSCESNYPKEVQNINACKYGCKSYTPETSDEPGSFLSNIMDLFSKLHGLSPISSATPDRSDSEAPSEGDPKVRVMVIRRFRIRLPIGDQAEADPTMDNPMSPDMMSGPFGGMFRMGNDQAPEDVAQPPMIPHMIMIHAKEPTISERMSVAARYMGSHPMTILFTVTLVALCILLIVQLTLECKRRRRANHFQYNQFDQLPTYVEATTVKVPVDLQEGPKDKSMEA